MQPGYSSCAIAYLITVLLIELQSYTEHLLTELIKYELTALPDR